MYGDVNKDKMITLDGSLYEGGGQIIRNGLSLSVVLGTPVRIINIRANRPKPGLMPQHLTSLNLLSEMTNAVVQGSYIADTETAGSISLMLQLIIPPLIYNDDTTTSETTVIDLRGGTNVKFSPQIETLQMGLLPLLNNLLTDGRLKYKIDFKARGCYPKGGGRIIFSMEKLPVETYPTKPIVLTNPGKITSAHVSAWSCGKGPIASVNNAVDYVVRELSAFGCVPTMFITDKPSSLHPYCSGIGIVAASHTDTGCILTSDHIIERNDKFEAIAEHMATEMSNLNKCVDSHIQDQLILFMALSEGVSSIKCSYPLTNHTLSAMYVVNQFYPDYNFRQVVNEQDQSCILSYRGIGWTPTSI
ncbi:hypothetical protein GJ496_009835 [Pomphorhynchus laevis]|nr:hypothetical protein GJ496_009835 [Pomphorhynchus laevis]